MAQPRQRDAREALELARMAFNLSSELTHATALPSYDDQNWLLHSGEVPRYVLKVAAANAECRGFADEAATREQLMLENAAMRALHAGGVSVPRPLRAKSSQDVIRVPTPPRTRARARTLADASAIALRAGAAPAADDGSASARDDSAGVARASEGTGTADGDASTINSARTGSASSTAGNARPAGEDARPAVIEFVRLLTFESGEHLARAVHSPELLRRFGFAVAQSAHALAARLGPRDVAIAAARKLTWDLANASAARRHLPAVADASDRAIAAAFLARFDACDAMRAQLPRQVLHGDLNDYNVLVSAQFQKPIAASQSATAFQIGAAQFQHAPAAAEAPAPAAAATAPIAPSSAGLTVLDFGDLVFSARVYDLAIALAYVCQNKPSGAAALDAACAVVRGYSEYAASQPRTARSRRLNRAELRVLHTCVCARLAQSVLNCAHAIAEEPANAAYLAVNSAPGWALMRQWAELPAATAEAAYLAAAAAGAGPIPPLEAAIARASDWLADARAPTRREALLAAALAGAAVALVVAVGIAAVRVVERRGAG
jgi:Ser/Thr protein kinase RdoA (MazF antagonist)